MGGAATWHQDEPRMGLTAGRRKILLASTAARLDVDASESPATGGHAGVGWSVVGAFRRKPSAVSQNENVAVCRRKWPLSFKPLPIQTSLIQIFLIAELLRQFQLEQEKWLACFPPWRTLFYFISWQRSWLLRLWISINKHTLPVVPGCAGLPGCAGAEVLRIFGGWRKFKPYRTVFSMPQVFHWIHHCIAAWMNEMKWIERTWTWNDMKDNCMKWTWHEIDGSEMKGHDVK